MKRQSRESAFTIVELMVVIAIIALLMGIMMPAMSSVMQNARAAKSMSNLRQWGIGTMTYANINRETLPWEGLKNANEIGTNFQETSWWANAIPPFVGEPPYQELAAMATSMGVDVPVPSNSQSIFVDPGAELSINAPWKVNSPQTGEQLQFFFCYVPNAQLNNTREEQIKQRLLDSGMGNNQASALASFQSNMRLHMISDPARTVIMLEMRTVDSEIPTNDPFRGKQLSRHRADWKRFAARHFKGGHMLFADGRVELKTNREVTRPRDEQGFIIPPDANGNWPSDTD
ncbi:MAG: type II secretion system protein, partial [Phycisphaerales bacterium]